MDRKKVVLKAALSLLTLAACFVTVKSYADTTVGGSGLRGNAGVVNTLPGTGSTKRCFSIALTTNSWTTVVAANTNAMDIEIINVSSRNVILPQDYVGAAATYRPPMVFLASASAMNLGFPLDRNNITKLNARPLWPCAMNTGGVAPLGVTCVDRVQNGTTYTGAIYAVAESSGVTGGSLGVEARVQGCYTAP